MKNDHTLPQVARSSRTNRAIRHLKTLLDLLGCALECASTGELYTTIFLLVTKLALHVLSKNQRSTKQSQESGKEALDDTS